MKELLIIITFMFCSPLFGGEWTNLSNLGTSLVGPKVEAVGNYVMISGNVGGIIPHVFKSTDRGENWVVALDDSVKRDETGKVIYHPVRSYDLTYTDSDHAIMMCEGLRFWRTDDGGKNWVYDSLRGGSKSQSDIIARNNIAIARYGSELYFSIDYGRNWDKYESKFNREFDLDNGDLRPHALFFLDDSTLIADGSYFVDFYHEDNQNFIIKSTDYGRNWEIIYDKERQLHFSYRLLNNKIIAVGSVQTKPYASTYVDVVQISTNGGYSWEIVLDTISSPSSTLNEIEFNNDMEGIAYSSGFSKLLRTSDGGRTWYRDYGTYDLDTSPDDYAYLPNGEILAVTRTGNVYKWTDPILSVEDDRKQEVEPSTKLYPNPLSINHALSIEFVPSFLGEVELTIIDITGRNISTFKLDLTNPTKQVLSFKPDNELTSGIYFLQISYKNGIAERHKFVVE